jgi:hypothetical protein
VPIQYARDDATQRIRLTLTDPFTAADAIASVERQLADSAWHDGLLVDMRAQSAPAGPGDVRSFSSRVGELVAAHGPRGPIAIVARDASPIASAQLHVVFAEKTESIEVFSTLRSSSRALDRSASAEPLVSEDTAQQTPDRPERLSRCDYSVTS